MSGSAGRSRGRAAAAGAPQVGIPRRRVLQWGALGVGVVVTGCRGVVVEDLEHLSAAYPDLATRLAEESPSATARPTAPPIMARDLGIATDIRLTPTADFYTVKYGALPDAADPATFTLEVSGLVEEPQRLGLADVEALPQHTLMRTLECISNPPGGALIGNAVWTGVRLADVISRAQPLPAAQAVHLRAFDGYDTGIPLALALDPESFLVHQMNGAQLPHQHGYPLRCLFAGRYGQKQPKWLNQIALTAEPALGHWEQQGWSDEAVIQINSRVDVPAAGGTAVPPVEFRGLAFSDLSGLARVEILLDDAPMGDAELLRAPEPYVKTVWTEWRWGWDAPVPGNHMLMAKAYDGNGVAQRRPHGGLLDDTKPDGTSAMERVRFFVPEPAA